MWMQVLLCVQLEIRSSPYTVATGKVVENKGQTYKAHAIISKDSLDN